MNRRDFLKRQAIWFLVPTISSCYLKNYSIPCVIRSSNSRLGHKLRATETASTIDTFENIGTVIVGGGIAGLSAAYHLVQQGKTDFILLDPEIEMGGNSCSGKNQYSSYPLGAHYLPIPSLENHYLIEFLHKVGIIDGFDLKGVPYYKEEYLCQSPQERLLVNHFWQDGMIPDKGLTSNEKQDIIDFFTQMSDYQFMKTSEGEFCFQLPLRNSHFDEPLLALDKITFKQWLIEHHFTSLPLTWYLNYCMRDDYGIDCDEIAALIAIHYFAARRSVSANDGVNSVLTWPEGNHFLARKMRVSLPKQALRNEHICLALDKYEIDSYQLQCFDSKTNRRYTIISKHVILATPQFVNSYLFKGSKLNINKPFVPEYTPWVVATLIVDEQFLQSDEIIHWDNVWMSSKGLGYIYAQHQHLEQVRGPRVLTWYMPVQGLNGKKAREFFQSKSPDYWREFILTDLSLAHSAIRNYVRHIEVQQWGHAMPKPIPGNYSKTQEFQPSKAEQIYFAHSDITGLSLFEEAFEQGRLAALQVQKSIQHG